MRYWGWLLMAVGVGANPQQARERPPSGVEVDETREVALATRLPTACVAIALQGATLYLDRDVLAREAAAPARGDDAARREAAITADRARELLAALGTARTPEGCTPLAVGALPAQAAYLVLEHLEAGRAALRDGATQALQPRVAIRYLGTQCGPMCGSGHIDLALPGQARPFWVVPWWQS